MKLSSCVFLIGLVGSSNAFSVSSTANGAQQRRAAAAQLNAARGSTDRRSMLNEVFTAASTLSAAALVSFPGPAFAADYVPQFKDMKQIYTLAEGLDRLLEKLKDPDQIETVREVRSPKAKPTRRQSYDESCHLVSYLCHTIASHHLYHVPFTLCCLANRVSRHSIGILISIQDTRRISL